MSRLEAYKIHESTYFWKAAGRITRSLVRRNGTKTAVAIMPHIKITVTVRIAAVFPFFLDFLGFTFTSPSSWGRIVYCREFSPCLTVLYILYLLFSFYLSCCGSQARHLPLPLNSRYTRHCEIFFYCFTGSNKVLNSYL